MQIFYRLALAGILLLSFISVYADGNEYILKHWDKYSDFNLDLLHFAKQAYRETYPDFFTEQELDVLFTQEYFDPEHDQEFLVLVHSSRILAYAKLIFADDQQFKLDKLYVASKYQNNRLGKSLLYACFSEAMQNNYRYIKLVVWTKNPRAINFYKQNGLQLSTELLRYYDQNGNATDEYDYIMTGDLQLIPTGKNIRSFEPCNRNTSEICMLKISG